MIDIREIQKIIPHRYPFLLVDRIIEISEKRIVGIKNVTMNEPFFAGHFPEEPVMPGVLIVESLAQAACVLSMNSEEVSQKANVVYFMGIDRARFRKPVVPGDQLRLEVEITRKRKVSRFTGKAYVGENLVAEAEIMAMIGKAHGDT